MFRVLEQAMPAISQAHVVLVKTPMQMEKV